MYNSRIIEDNGTFLGALILENDDNTRRFYATHDSVRSLHNLTMGNTEELKRHVIRYFRHGSVSL
ncbi:MAG: hypothetical protein GX413_08950 [Acetobacter sp.]|jgi:hypothetical protein|nr:hypothetical protein [Acetobacter sp.]